VDRNLPMCTIRLMLLRSLSARRAWIEIGVDFAQDWLDAGSLSARRAWIEIARQVCVTCRVAVALRKESVDRNPPTCIIKPMLLVALRKESVDRNC